jgi:hypothetical protein
VLKAKIGFRLFSFGSQVGTLRAGAAINPPAYVAVSFCSSQRRVRGLSRGGGGADDAGESGQTRLEKGTERRNAREVATSA